MAIRIFSFSYLLAGIFIGLFKLHSKNYIRLSPWLLLSITSLTLLLGVYHIKNASQIFNGRQWYNRLLRYNVGSERGLKWAGYYMILLSIIFSMIFFFR